MEKVWGRNPSEHLRGRGRLNSLGQSRRYLRRCRERGGYFQGTQELCWFGVLKSLSPTLQEENLLLSVPSYACGSSSVYRGSCVLSNLYLTSSLPSRGKAGHARGFGRRTCAALWNVLAHWRPQWVLWDTQEEPVLVLWLVNTSPHSHKHSSNF